ncbi:MAG: FtsH protease activity modulator HflK, partial [Acidobacteria bacterium]
MPEEFRTIEMPFKGRPPTKILILIPLVILALLLISDFVYTIEPEEIGVVLRFGKFDRTTEPGLHVKMPFPIEQLAKVPIQRQLKQEYGFRTREAGVRT